MSVYLHHLQAGVNGQPCVLAGISAICLRDSGPDLLQRDGTVKMWHALVASTLGTDIRLRLRFEAPSWRSEPTESMRLLSPPARSELVQRLTALDMCVAHAGEVAVVRSLAALRHLRLWTHTGYARGMFVMQPGAAAPPCQLSGLRTLQLYDLWPRAFFSPGTAASLQQLRSLCLHHCDIAEGEVGPAIPQLPDEMLRLPTLERLELSERPLLAMPNLRHLPALRTLVVAQGPEVDSLQVVGSAEDILAAAVRDTLGGATALTELCLIGTPVASRERADAIERLPHLRELTLDFWSDEVPAFWAATLQRRLRGRCHVRPATHHVYWNVD